MINSESATLRMSSLRMSSLRMSYQEPITKPKYEDYDYCLKNASKEREKLINEYSIIKKEIEENEKELKCLRLIFHSRMGRSIEDPFKEVCHRPQMLYFKIKNLIEKSKKISSEINKLEKYIKFFNKEINKLIPDAPPKKRRKTRNLPPTADERLQRIRSLNGIMALDEPGETINFSDSD